MRQYISTSAMSENFDLKYAFEAFDIKNDFIVRTLGLRLCICKER